MTERQRNGAVGLMVAVGFVLLGLLIFKFTDIATIGSGGYTIKVLMSDANGAAPNKQVTYLGKAAGAIKAVDWLPDKSGVRVIIEIRDRIEIPSNGVLVAGRTAFGDAYFNIRLPSDAGGGPAAAASPLPMDGSAEMKAQEGSGGMIPPEIFQIARDFKTQADATFKKVNDLLEERSFKEVDAGQKASNLRSTLDRIDWTVKTAADPENLDHLKSSMKSLALATAEFRTTIANFNSQVDGVADDFRKVRVRADGVADDFHEVRLRADALAAKLYDDAVKAGELIDAMKAMVAETREGKGSLGKFLTTDELHRNLNLLILQINETFKDLGRLTEKLEREGLLRKGG